MPTPGFTGQLSPARQQFLDSVGRPLAGGRVFHYLPGTTTPATTYADPNFTIPNPNPVPLDSAGRAAIYADQTLRQVLKSSTGVTIWDQETVTNIGTNSSSALTVGNIAALRANTTPYPLFYVEGYYAFADGGSGFFLWDQADTTSVDNGGTIIVDAGGRRYKRQRSPDQTNIRWFGAKGDGVTDDTTPIQAAITNGKYVECPAGNYVTTAGLNLRTGVNGQVIWGWGPQSTIFSPNGNFDVFTAPDAVDFCTIQDLGFILSSMTGGFAIKCDGADRFAIRNVRLDSAYNIVSIRNCNVCWIDRLYCQTVRGLYAIYCEGDTVNRSASMHFHDVIVGNGTGTKSWTGLYVTGGVSTFDTRSMYFIGPLRGIHTLNPGGASLSRPNFHTHVDFQVDFPLEEGVWLEGGYGYWFSNMYIQGTTQNVGMRISEDIATVRVSNGHIRGVNKEAAIIGGQDVMFTNSSFGPAGFPNSVYDAVVVTGTARRIMFSSCQFGSHQGAGTTQRWGAQIQAGAHSIHFAACDFFGCAAGRILDNSGYTLPGNVVDVGGGASEYVSNDRFQGWEAGCAYGYGAEATLTITGGQITGVTITNPGQEYQFAPSFVARDANGGGTGASFTVTVSNGQVTGVTIVSPGSGYSANTVAYFRSGGNLPTLRARHPVIPDASATLLADGQGLVRLGNEDGLGFSVSTLETPAVNHLQARGRASGLTPDIAAVGSDTDIDIAFTPRGSGLVRFGSYAAGVPVATGYITMKTAAGQTIQIPVRLV